MAALLSPECARFGPDRHLLVASSRLSGNVWDGAIRIYDNTPKSLAVHKAAAGTATPAGCSAAAWMAPRFVVAACDTGAIRVFKWEGTGELVQAQCVKGHDGAVSCLDVHHAAAAGRGASGCMDGTLRLWDVQANLVQPVGSRSGHPGGVSAVAWQDANPDVLASAGSRDGTLCLWDARTPLASACSTVQCGASAAAVAWSPGPAAGHTLAAGLDSGRVAIFDIRNLAQAAATVPPAEGEPSAVASLCFSADGARIGCGARGGQVRVLAAEGGGWRRLERPAEAEAHAGCASAVAWDPRKPGELVSVGWDGRLLRHVDA